MGVRGLWAFLKPLSTQIPFSDLRNYRIAIDISIWINKLLRGNVKSGAKRSIKDVLIIFYKKLCELMLLGIKPIFVFDGSPPEIKLRCLHKRRLQREIIEKRAEDIKFQITKEAMLEHAVNSNCNEFLTALKKINYEQDKIDPLKVDNTIHAQPSDQFYIAHNIKRIDIDSTEYNDLSNTEKYEYLLFLHDLIKYEIPDVTSSNELSTKQLDKFVLLGKINKKCDELSQIHQRSRLKRTFPEMNVKLSSVNSHAIFSNPTQYYAFLKDTGLIKDEHIPELNSPHTSISTLNTKIKMNSLSYDVRNANTKINVKIQPRPLSSASNSSDSEPYRKLPNKSSITPFIPMAPEKKYTDSIQQQPIISKKTTCEFFEEPTSFFPSDPIQFSADINPVKNEIPLTFDKNCHILDDLIKTYSKYYNQSCSIPRELFIECCMLISLFGMAFIVAPGEAEAQCAALQNLGLCDLISSEDSDSFLFGAEKLIRGLFSLSSNKSLCLHSAHVELYDMKNVSLILGLNRELLICMAMISGCDYDDGLNGMGIKTAYKLITEFYDNGDVFEILKKIKNSEKILQKDCFENFPSQLVFRSLLKPLINDNKESFVWNEINFEMLEKYLEIKLGFCHFEIRNSFKVLKYIPNHTKANIDKSFDEYVIKLFSKNVEKISKKLRSYQNRIV
ncbi:hypothetical protein HZS_4732 [Henneguya salminicola]|nr:hypothetical protein HZS_4732 [Henneguya salminicola]